MKILASFLIFLSLGCNHVTISRYEKASASTKSTEIELDSFALGFVPVKLPSENEACPQSKIDSVNLSMNTKDVLLSIVTIGIYVPHRAEITCTPVTNAAR